MANTRFEFGRFQGSDEVQGSKDCLNGIIPDPTMVGGEGNLSFLDALKCSSISELILPEKTWKGIKAVSYYIYIYIYMKTMCPPGYHHNGIVVITERAHCFHDYIYITLILLL